MKRDTSIDTYRGLAIIWVLFIHCVYWVGFFTSSKLIIVKSYLLFEMPLLFFITGASNSLTGNTKNIFLFYIKRLQRIIIPFWAYAFFCVFLIQTTVTFLKAPSQLSYSGWFITLGFRNYFWSNVPFLTWHLWFIPVFIVIICFIPCLKFLYNRLKGKLKYIPLAIIIAFIFILDKNKLNGYSAYYFLKNTLFYGFWIYLGLFYIEFKNNPWKRKTILVLAILSYFMTYILIKTGYSMDMQVNKFPPNMAFMTMNIGNFSILVLLKNYVIKLLKIFNLEEFVIRFGEHSYTVYLYQPFSFLFGAMMLDVLKITPNDYDIIGFLYYLIINLFASLVYINLFGGLEKISFTKRFFHNY